MPIASGGWRVTAALQLCLLAMQVCWACLETVLLAMLLAVAWPRAPANGPAARLRCYRKCLQAKLQSGAALLHGLCLVRQALQSVTVQLARYNDFCWMQLQARTCRWH